MSRIANISSKLVSGVGFSNGWAELALKKPPPLVPSSLIASWRGDRALAIVCVRALERRRGCVAVQVLRDALPDEDERADEEIGSSM